MKKIRISNLKAASDSSFVHSLILHITLRFLDSCHRNNFFQLKPNLQTEFASALSPFDLVKMSSTVR